MTEYLWLLMCGIPVVGHCHSMDRKMAVFQSLTTPDRIRPPSCQDNTKSVRTSSFICCRRLAV